MTIQFFYEGHREWYAMSINEVYNGFRVDELQWATIESKHKKYIVRWDDSWGNQIFCDTLEDAKAHILVNHERHTPSPAGKSEKVDDFGASFGMGY